jgi:hypothetical protein
MTTSNPPVSETVNPAGEPKVSIKPAEPYTRDTFMRDLKKVASKQSPKK